MFQIIAQSFPNNEIRINYTRLKSPSDYFSENSDGCNPNGCGDDSRDILGVGSGPSLSSDTINIPPLSLGLNSKTQRSSAGYGTLPAKPTTFGLNAKRQLTRSGAALETVAPPEECLFLTGTLPGSTEDAFRTIAAYSSYIVNSLKAWIATRVKSKLDFYCWEYQKRGALHLHYCVHCPDRSDRDFILSEFRTWWISALSRVGNSANCDLFRKSATFSWLSDLSKVRAVAEVCRKSPARYLSKYLSKSASPKRGPARAFTPTRWWGTSRPLKALLESLTKKTVIAIGGYHQVFKIREKVVHECQSTEGVTYGYRHKFGMGHTWICFPSDTQENLSLWTSIQAISTMKQVNSQPDMAPSQILRPHRDRVLNWARYWESNLTISHQGLKAALNRYSNTIVQIIPSKSPEPLKSLLYWAALTSDIKSLSRYTPALTKSDERMLQECLDALDAQMKVVAENGWS